MAVRYIFNTSGDYVAFISGNGLFSTNGTWLGLVLNGNEVFNSDGLFVGHLLNDDRIVRDKRRTFPRSIPRPPRVQRQPPPMRPMRRLRSPRVPEPYEDVFEGIHGPVTTIGQAGQVKRFDHLLSAFLFAADDQFLGLISADRFDPRSITNRFGEYGSPFSATSIFNDFGGYGGEYGALSPFNPYSSTPPKIVREATVLAYLTVNQYIHNRIDPNEFSAWLNTL